MSNLLKRVLVGALGIPLLLYVAVQGGWALIAMIVLLQAVSLWEWTRMYAANGSRPNAVGMSLMTAGIDVFVFGSGNSAAAAASMVLLGIAFFLEVLRRNRRPLRDLSAAVLFVIYVALPLALWSLFGQSPGTRRWEPAGALALLFVTTWICDTAAYAIGRWIGRHKLDVAASPKKTVEGFVAGALASALVLPAMYALRLSQPDGWDFVVIPLIVGIAGQIGDLLESLMKREVQIKDTSAILPGHGGLLDRFDSLLLSTPLLFAYMLLSAS